MSDAADGMNYAPKGKPSPVVKPGEFPFAAACLDHGHIYGQCNGLIEAGGQLRYVYDPVPERVADFVKRYPEVKAVDSLERILEDKEIRMVAAAAIPSERCGVGLRVMDAGKDYFTDKCPFTTLEQLESARAKAAATGQKYMVYYSERLHVECAIFAGQLIQDDVIGRVVQVIGTGPHRLAPAGRPKWFFEREKYGGILTDIGSHQVEQFLYFSGAKDGRVLSAVVGNYANPEYPELEDFGEASILADNGSTDYFRVDWLNPDGLRSWGDGRTFILGTKGYMELRKYIDVARDKAGNQLYLVTQEGEYHMDLNGKVGYPFFGELILDSLNRTEKAMTQAHAFKAAELALKAQDVAIRAAG